MKPRTVLLTLELRDCDVPLAELRRSRGASLRVGECESILVAVAQATATVAQPSRLAAAVQRYRSRA